MESDDAVPPQAVTLEASLLESEVDALLDRVKKYRSSAKFFLPDLVLAGLAREFSDSAYATLSIALSPFPRASVALSRAAFETALDLQLYSFETDLDLAAAKMKVVEIFEWDHMHRQGAVIAKQADPTYVAPTAHGTVDDWVAEEAQAWQSITPGSRAIFATALKQVRQERKAGIFHWSGLRTKKLMAERIANLHNSDSIGPTISSFYNVLSQMTHPSPRTGERYMSLDQGVAQTIITPSPDAWEQWTVLPFSALKVSVHSAADAFDRVAARRSQHR